MSQESDREEDALDRLVDAAERIVTRQGWEQANRLGLLAVHGLIGLIAGTLILINGSAMSFDLIGLWVRSLTGGIALVGGAVLLAGLVRTPRSVRLEVTGLVLLGIWDLMMAVAFLTATIAVGELNFTWPWIRVPDDIRTRLYPIALYVGMLALISVHLWTLRNIHKDNKVLRRTGHL